MDLRSRWDGKATCAKRLTESALSTGPIDAKRAENFADFSK
jgi:hypothetical protein